VIATRRPAYARAERGDAKRGPARGSHGGGEAQSLGACSRSPRAQAHESAVQLRTAFVRPGELWRLAAPRPDPIRARFPAAASSPPLSQRSSKL
jgi:hypothetical protein